MNEKEKDRLFYRFINGESIADLACEYGMRWSSMYQIVGGRLPCVVDLTNEDKNKIIEMYLSGYSTTRIAEHFMVSHKLIGRILDENDIKRIHNGVRKWNLNEHYFDSIDTQNKAYILGLLYADGYNGINKSTVRIQLQYTDVELLKQISREIESDKPLKYINCSSKVASNGFISKDMYQLEAFSSHMCHTLDAIGMHQNKSLILEFPRFENKSLARHFIRGYYDGDGSFTYSNANSAKRFQGLITITSTESFCEECLTILRKEIGIGGGIYDASCHNGITKVITISGNRQCKNVLDWLYFDADMYLHRKYDKYINAYYPSAA